MTENNQSEAPKKKMTLQEAMQQKLESKKNQSSAGKGTTKGDNSTKKMKSQQAPVPTAEERDQTALPPEVMQTLLSQAQTQNAPQPAPMPQNNEEEMAEEV